MSGKAATQDGTKWEIRSRTDLTVRDVRTLERAMTRTIALEATHAIPALVEYDDTGELVELSEAEVRDRAQARDVAVGQLDDADWDVLDGYQRALLAAYVRNDDGSPVEDFDALPASVYDELGMLAYEEEKLRVFPTAAAATQDSDKPSDTAT